MSINWQPWALAGVMLVVNVGMVQPLRNHSVAIEDNTRRVALAENDITHLETSTLKDKDMQALCTTVAVLQETVGHLSKQIDRLEGVLPLGK